MNYVTYDADGSLTGGYLQDLLPEHAAAHIEVTDEQRINWVHYKANAARDGVIAIAPPTPASMAPMEVSMVSAQTVMYTSGWLAPWEALLAGMPGEDGDLARIKWRAARTVRRDDSLVVAATAALGHTAAEADELFIAAGALDAQAA